MKIMYEEGVTKLLNDGEVPAYLLDVDELQLNYQDFNQAFSSVFERFQVAYSYKTNYIPWLCKWMHRQGALAEVVSGMEYQLARQYGVPGEQIIFNGPAKKENEIQAALHDGALINLDSLQEIEFVVELARSGFCKSLASPPRLGLRLNFSLGDGSPAGHFGLSIEDGEADLAVEKLLTQAGLAIISVHGHRSTPDRGVSGFMKIAETLATFASTRLDLNELRYLNVGGGFGRNVDGMELPPIPLAAEYAKAIAISLDSVFKDSYWPTVVIEPGLCLAGSPFHFLSRVEAIKVIKGERFAILDTSFHNIKPSMHRFNLPIRVYSPDGKVIRGDSSSVTFAGYTCMETDILGRYTSVPEINTGDIIDFANVGAYTIVFNPQFIRERPPIFAVAGDSVEQIRRRETVSDILQLYPADR